MPRVHWPEFTGQTPVEEEALTGEFHIVYMMPSLPRRINPVSPLGNVIQQGVVGAQAPAPK